MNRRSFLGSIIGTVFGTSFLALDSLKEKPPESFIDTPYRVAVYEANHKVLIWAPGIEFITWKEGELSIQAADLQITESGVYSGAVLFDHRIERGFTKFSELMCVQLGDVLKVNYSVRTNVSRGQLEEYMSRRTINVTQA